MYMYILYSFIHTQIHTYIHTQEGLIRLTTKVDEHRAHERDKLVERHMRSSMLQVLLCFVCMYACIYARAHTHTHNTHTLTHTLHTHTHTHTHSQMKSGQMPLARSMSVSPPSLQQGTWSGSWTLLSSRRGSLTHKAAGAPARGLG